jgi:hypothetical protein
MRLVNGAVDPLSSRGVFDAIGFDRGRIAS